jgi:hypothetical protein
MTFENYLKMIKRYLKSRNRSWEKCDEFYRNLRYKMPIVKKNVKKIKFLINIDEIEEQSEPWIDVKKYEFLDKQIEELMKEYGYM